MNRRWPSCVVSFVCAAGCAHTPSQPVADTRADDGADAPKHEDAGPGATERERGELAGDAGAERPAVFEPSDAPGVATAIAPHPTDRPRGRVILDGVEVSGGTIANAESAVARRRSRFHACYEKGLKTHPDMQGSVVLVATVEADGQVTKVSGGADDALASVAPCLKAVLVGAGFSPPDGRAATVSVTITCLVAK